MRFVLRVIEGPSVGARLLFPPGEYVFGRSCECHVRFLLSRYVSRELGLPGTTFLVEMAPPDAPNLAVPVSVSGELTGETCCFPEGCTEVEIQIPRMA
jgi:hypothetical protein